MVKGEVSRRGAGIQRPSTSCAPAALCLAAAVMARPSCASGEISSAQRGQGSPELTPRSAARSALTDCAGSTAEGAAASEQDLHLPPSTGLGASQSQP